MRRQKDRQRLSSHVLRSLCPPTYYHLALTPARPLDTSVDFKRTEMFRGSPVSFSRWSSLLLLAAFQSGFFRNRWICWQYFVLWFAVKGVYYFFDSCGARSCLKPFFVLFYICDSVLIYLAFKGFCKTPTMICEAEDWFSFLCQSF